MSQAQAKCLRSSHRETGEGAVVVIGDGAEAFIDVGNRFRSQDLAEFREG